MKRLLITGASGFLGGHLCLQARTQWQVVGAYNANAKMPAGVTARQLNLAEQHAVHVLLEEIDPSLIIHAAVWQVDACERDPQMGELVNITATRTMAEWCARRRRRLVYISSDLVFDGARGWYSETDLPQPLLRYGENKWEAERTALSSCPNASAARLPLMYGFPAGGGANFFMKMIEALRYGEPLRVFSDQFRSPGLVSNMAAAVLELAASDFTGSLHIAGTQRCSRAEMAKGLCRALGSEESLLEEVSMFAVPTAAPRPRDVSLDSSRAQQFLKTRLLGYEEGLQILLRDQVS